MRVLFLVRPALAAAAAVSAASTAAAAASSAGTAAAAISAAAPAATANATAVAADAVAVFQIYRAIPRPAASMTTTASTSRSGLSLRLV